MTQDEAKIVERALHSMARLIYQLEPDPEYMEMYGVEAVLKQGQDALQIINKAQGE
jgi:hypothetical protein